MNTRTQVSTGLLALIPLICGCGGENVTSILPKYDRVAQSQVALNQVSHSDTLESEVTAPAISQRKMIYNADIWIKVTDIDVFDSALTQMVSAGGGFIGEYVQDRASGDSSSGTWKLRVPTAQLNATLVSIEQLGYITNKQIRSQDVTDQYVDLESRLRNKLRTEERLLRHLTEHNGKMEDLLKIEVELDRVREQVERMQGQTRVLTDQTSFATLVIHVSSSSKFDPALAPSLATDLWLTLTESINGMQIAGRSLLILLVALLPWMIPSGLIAVVISRRISRIWKLTQL